MKPTTEQIWFRTTLQKNNRTITDVQLEKLAAFSELLLHWNKKINLISRRDEGGVWTNHILLSLAFHFMIQFVPGQRVLDLGTGGGLPGIPLSIILPEVHFTLLDSIRKKTAAVKAIISSLGIENIDVVCARAEQINTKVGFRNAFDAVIARAVTDLALLIKWSFPFLRKIGDTSAADHLRPLLATLKGGELDKELLTSQKLFPGAVFQVIPLMFPGSELFPTIEKKLIVVNPED